MSLGPGNGPLKWAALGGVRTEKRGRAFLKVKHGAICRRRVNSRQTEAPALYWTKLEIS